MSLDVPTALLERAQPGEVDDADFVDCVRLSLPYAWQVISAVAADLELAGEAVEFADHEIPPPSEVERGQLLRALASDAIRGGLERHFGVKLAFQNCHRVAEHHFMSYGRSTQLRWPSKLHCSTRSPADGSALVSAGAAHGSISRSSVPAWTAISTAFPNPWTCCLPP